MSVACDFTYTYGPPTSNAPPHTIGYGKGGCYSRHISTCLTDFFDIFRNASFPHYALYNGNSDEK